MPTSTIIQQLTHHFHLNLSMLPQISTTNIYPQLLLALLSLGVSYASWPNIFTIYLMIISNSLFEDGIPDRTTIEALLESLVVLAGIKQFGKSVRWLSEWGWYRRRYRVLALGVFLSCCVALLVGGE
jgi:hypothetical protein